MGALTNIYVATTSGSDITGDGSSGNPYATVQAGAFALGTRDTTNGNFINLSGEEVLASTLSFATWGSPTFNAPTIIRDWVGGPDGTGGLDGNDGNFPICDKDYVSFHNIRLHNTGTSSIMNMNLYTLLFGCTIYDSSNSQVTAIVNHNGGVVGCSLSNCGSLNAGGVASVQFLYNWLFEGPTNTFSGSGGYAIGGTAGNVHRNIITLKSGSAHGGIASSGGKIWNNSIFATTGTGSGILIDSAGSQVYDNLIEGFSGSGGTGISIDTNDSQIACCNAVYNCTTYYNFTGDAHIDVDNETLGASPFAKSGSNTFANRFSYFAPVNTGNVIEGGFPTGSRISKGAVQVYYRIPDPSEVQNGVSFGANGEQTGTLQSGGGGGTDDWIIGGPNG